VVRISALTQSIVLVGGWVLLLSGSVAAQSTQYRAPRETDGELRWKFQQGQIFRMITEQNTSMSMTINDQPFKTANKNVNEMTLAIGEVSSDGTAKATASLDRMMMDMDANGQKMSFDTADEAGEAIGPMAEVANMIRPMIGKLISQEMSASGKVSNVNVPDDMLPDAANPIAAGMLNKKSLEEMSSRGSLEFPVSKMDMGHTWQIKADMEMGPAKVTTTTDYKYLGVKEGPDGPLHVFEGRISMQFPQGVAGSTIDVVDEDSKATFYFDGVKGRLHGTELAQNMKMKISAGGQSSEQHVVQSMKMTLEESKP